MAGGMAQISMASQPARIDIDTSQARREMGYLSMRELSESLRDQGLRAAAAGISATARQGDSYITSLPGGDNAIAAMAFEGMLRDLRESEFRFNMVPLSPPDIHVQPGYLSIDFLY